MKSQFCQAQNLLCGDHCCWLNSCYATCSWSLNVLWIFAERCLQAASPASFTATDAPLSHAVLSLRLPRSVTYRRHHRGGAAHRRLAQDTCRDVLLQGGGFRILRASSQQKGSHWWGCRVTLGATCCGHWQAVPWATRTQSWAENQQSGATNSPIHIFAFLGCCSLLQYQYETLTCSPVLLCWVSKRGEWC